MKKPDAGAAGKHHRNQQIEEAPHHASQGKHEIKYSPEEYPVPVNWTH